MLSRFTRILVFIGLMISAVHFANAGSVNEIRFGAHDGQTRIVLELSELVDYNLQTLPSPDRLVLDLGAGTVYNSTAGTDPTNLVVKTRFGVPDSQKSRIVFDLAGPLTNINHFILPPGNNDPGYRLVLDLNPSAIITNSAVQPAEVVVEKPIVELPSQKPEIIKEEMPVFTGEIPPLPTPKPASLINKKQYVIFLDAGHGGRDPGSIATDKTREKDIVLKLAHRIKDKLEASGRYKVYLTREGDYYIKLRERFKKARDKDADIFISLHADKIHIPSVRGASVYTLSETASDKETARLAKQENNAGVIAGVDLAVEDQDVANILLDLARRETLNESKLFAELFVTSLNKHDIRTLPNPHRFAGFAVLKAPDVPSVLVEAGFVSNETDTKLMQQKEFQNDFADALHASINSFFDRLERLNAE